MSGFEIERKWLVEEPPAEALAVPGDEIAQGYLAITEDGTEVRLRHRGDRCFLTVKSAGGLVRGEREVEITSQQFEALWPATDGRRLEKVRRVLDGGDGARIELDVYGGALSGLIVAEVEFADADAGARFDSPAWFGREVTGDPAYKNQRLAVDGLGSIGK
jgi:CYTH domain-containing protein